MSKYIIFFLVVLLIGAGYYYFFQKKDSTVIQSTTEPVSSFYNYSFKTIDGKEQQLSLYKGKLVMIVNTASKCGYTYQYKDLETLYGKYKDKLVIIGFPTNDFLWQEPGSNKQIADFCRINYGVSFIMAEKITVKGRQKHPLYQWLTDPALNGWNNQKPSWNFSKYLVSRDGKLLSYFGPKVEPLSPEIIELLDKN